MSAQTQLRAPKGTHDQLPEDWHVRHEIIDAARGEFERAGFGHISTPTFEDVALFERGVGEGTDIVGKEMYVFEDRGGRSLALRPEGTAPVARAYVEHGMHRRPQPVRLWYHAQMFRYERPQKGRYREHWQVGAEIMGSAEPVADADAIVTLASIYRALGLSNVTLHLNSIGDSRCRPAYTDHLVEFLVEHASELCADCRDRTHTNPLRTLDCKVPECKAVLENAPTIFSHLCADCRTHFDTVCALLDAAGVAWTHDERLVRGLDYYTRTTFEFTASGLGSQDAIGGGGRYDGLVEQLGGPPTPCVGFGCGVDRLALALIAARGDAVREPVTCDIWMATAAGGNDTVLVAAAAALRDAGIRVELNSIERSEKGQLKLAAKRGAQLAIFTGNGDSDFRIHHLRNRTDHATGEATLIADALQLWEEQCTTTSTNEPHGATTSVAT